MDEDLVPLKENTIANIMLYPPEVSFSSQDVTMCNLQYNLPTQPSTRCEKHFYHKRLKIHLHLTPGYMPANVQTVFCSPLEDVKFPSLDSVELVRSFSSPPFSGSFVQFSQMSCRSSTPLERLQNKPLAYIHSCENLPPDTSSPFLTPHSEFTGCFFFPTPESN